MAFPKDQDVGPNCELVLWITKYNNRLERPIDEVPLTLNHIYVNTPLINLLNNDIAPRVAEAANAASGPYISAGNEQAVQNAITNYPAGTVDALRPLGWFFTNAPSNATRTLFVTLWNAGFYLPPWHKSTHIADQPKLARLTTGAAATQLWAHLLPVTGTVGQATFEILFNTSAAALLQTFPGTYAALSEAKRVGVLRHHRDQPHSRSPLNSTVGTMQSGNRRCCSLGECIDSQYPADYCQVIPGTPDCNAMSDACHV